MTRPRWGIVVAGAVVFLLVALQILLPSFGERAIESRLTESAIPKATLARSKKSIVASRSPV